MVKRLGWTVGLLLLVWGSVASAADEKKLTLQEKLQHAALNFKGERDVLRLDLEQCREESALVEKSRDRWKEAAKAYEEEVDDGKIGEWVWPVVAGGAIAVFAIGFVLGVKGE